MTDFADIKKDYEEFSRRAQDIWQPYYKNADVALNAYSGRTWTQSEVDYLRDQGRYPEEFNIIRPKINLFSGYARDNMKSTIVGPVEDADQETADQLSEVMRFVYAKGDTNSIQLNAYDDCLKTGAALVEIYLDYTDDPIHGDIKYHKRSFNSFLIDPNFEKQDLSDASEISIRDFLTREDAKSLLPMVDPKVIDDISAYSNDNKFRYLRNNQRFYTNSDLISYDQYYRKVSKIVKEIVDIETGQAVMFAKDEDEDFLREKMQFAKEMFGIDTEIRKRTKQTVELNIVLSGEVVYSGPDPLGLDDYPFVLYICYWEPHLTNFGIKLQGMSLGLVDTQRAFNKRMIRKQDVMDTAINTGGLYRVGDIDPDDIKMTGAGQFVPVDSDRPFSEIYQPFQQGSIPPGWQEETVYLQELSHIISGVNESQLGFDEGGNTQVSGKLAEVRSANGLRANRSILDNFEKSMKYLGQKTLRVMQKHYGPGKIRRILNKEPTTQFFSQEFDKYDAVIKEAVLSQTQRDAFYFELLRLVEIYGPDMIPASLAIKNLPMAGASELQKTIETQERQKQQAQQDLQEDKQRAARLEESITEQNIALAQERRAKVLSDVGLAQERQSEIRGNIAKANLDQAKTLAEIEKLKDENLLQLMQFLEFLKQKETQQHESKFKESLQVSEAFRMQSEPDVQPNGQAQVAQQQPLGG